MNHKQGLHLQAAGPEERANTHRRTQTVPGLALTPRGEVACPGWLVLIKNIDVSDIHTAEGWKNKIIPYFLVRKAPGNKARDPLLFLELNGEES